MRMLAEVFVATAAVEQVQLGWDGSDVAALDGMCDRYVIPGQRSMSTRQAFAARMGAYVGELLVQNAGGRWTYDDAERAAVILLPSGKLVDPTDRVTRRLTVGHHHSVGEFYRAVLCGDLLAYTPRQARQDAS